MPVHPPPAHTHTHTRTQCNVLQQLLAEGLNDRQDLVLEALVGILTDTLQHLLHAGLIVERFFTAGNALDVRSHRAAVAAGRVVTQRTGCLHRGARLDADTRGALVVENRERGRHIVELLEVTKHIHKVISQNSLAAQPVWRQHHCYQPFCNRACAWCHVLQGWLVVVTEGRLHTQPLDNRHNVHDRALVASGVQYVTDRQILWQQRYEEARGGPYSRGLGLVAGLTAGCYFYCRQQRHGFTGFFPLARHNAGHYTWILGGAFIGFHLASSWVSAVTGDSKQQFYLAKNKYKIISG